MFVSRCSLSTTLIRTPLLMMVLAVVLESPQELLAQSIGSHGAEGTPLRLPAPIRFSARPTRAGSNQAQPVANQVLSRAVQSQTPAVEQRGAAVSLGQRGAVRAVQYQTPHDSSVQDPAIDTGLSASTEMPSQQTAGGASWLAAPSHQIVRAPRIVYPGQHHGETSGPSRVSLHEQHEVPPLIHQRTPQLPPAVIPDASQREVWKSPYSYGYFGASGSRQWARHYGYRDRDREWRLRW